TCFASDSRSSVVSPMAETTTTTSCPAARVRITRSATCLMRATSATLDPPYFCTTIDIAGLQEAKLQEGKDARPAIYSNVATTGAWSLVPTSILTGQPDACAASASLAMT